MNLLVCIKLNPEQGFNTTAKTFETIIKNLKKRFNLYIFIFYKKKRKKNYKKYNF